MTKNMLVLLLLFPISASSSTHDTISQYLKRHYDPYHPDILERVIAAAKRVSEWFPEYSREDLLCMVSNETRFKLGQINFNLPGTYIPKYGLCISTFSCDYGITGINDMNVPWTYSFGKLLQETPSPARLQKLRDFLRQEGKHPKLLANLECFQLEPISLKQINSVRKQALLEFLTHGKIDKSRYTFKEETQNDLESMMVYRIFIENDRKRRGWPSKEKDGKLFEILSRVEVAQK